MEYRELKTPDNATFRISTTVDTQEADYLEKQYSKNLLADSLLPINGSLAYEIDQGKILYRQYINDIGFIFPSLTDYKAAIIGVSFAEANIQVDDKGNFYVMFLLFPKFANELRKKIKQEILNYESFEGRRFFILEDNSIAMLIKRTEELSDGYWFATIKDFEHFYYILSGKKRKNMMQ